MIIKVIGFLICLCSKLARPTHVEADRMPRGFKAPWERTKKFDCDAARFVPIPVEMREVEEMEVRAYAEKIQV